MKEPKKTTILVCEIEMIEDECYGIRRAFQRQEWSDEDRVVEIRKRAYNINRVLDGIKTRGEKEE